MTSQNQIRGHFIVEGFVTKNMKIVIFAAGLILLFQPVCKNSRDEKIDFVKETLKLEKTQPLKKPVVKVIKISFAKDLQPILVKSCISCHETYNSHEGVSGTISSGKLREYIDKDHYIEKGDKLKFLKWLDDGGLKN